MALEVHVDWNRLFLGALIVGGVALGLILLITSMPSPKGPVLPRRAQIPRVRAAREEAARLEPTTAPAAGRLGDWQYARPDWEFAVENVTYQSTVRVVVLDSEAPEEVRIRPAPEGRVWALVAVAAFYKGQPSSAGPRLDFGDLRAVPTGGAPEPLLSARPVGQAFFKVFDRRAFPPIVLDPEQTRASLELLFRLPTDSGTFVVRRARGARP